MSSSLGKMACGAVTLVLCLGCSGERVTYRQPRGDQRQWLESLLGVQFPPDTRFVVRKSIAGLDPLHYLVFDIPKGQLDSFIASSPFAGGLKEGDRTSKPVPVQLDPASDPIDAYRAGLSPDDLVLRNDAHTADVPAWNPDGALRFRYGTFVRVPRSGANFDIARVLISLDRPDVARFYIAVFP